MKKLGKKACIKETIEAYAPGCRCFCACLTERMNFQDTATVVIASKSYQE